MASDLVDDEKWQQMLAEFNRHFWGKRVPAFFTEWTESQQITPAQWLPRLKVSIHGLAGVAALVDQEIIGDMAREIEGRWDTDGPSAEPIPLIQRLSDTLMKAKLAHDGG